MGIMIMWRQDWRVLMMVSADHTLLYANDVLYAQITSFTYALYENVVYVTSSSSPPNDLIHSDCCAA